MKLELIRQIVNPHAPIKKMDTNEAALTIWRCQDCDQQCAGESIYKLCSTCESIRAVKDQKADDQREYYNDRRDQDIMDQFELRNENQF